MSNDTSIAIIGISGRFPKAADLEMFWDNLRQGREGITFFTDAELIAAGVSRSDIENPDYVKARAVLENVDLFDADFFGYGGREAQWMDPQQRLFLEQAHTALEHAGYACGDQPLHVGVFAGCSVSSYLLSNLLPSGTIDSGVGNMQVMIGNDKDYLASRTSYKLNLTGPSLTIQTACSTSLTAVHVACQSLLGGECDMALAGGSCISLPQISGYMYQEGSIASPDGHCRPFDALAKGTNGGSGVGVIVLKRLDDAIADGDSIYAVIRGSAINNDGTDKVGFTAPSQNGQAAVIAEALAISGVDASEIGYIEAHGTATPVGDPIEVAALTQVYQSATKKKSYCAIGSVKSNLGHLDAAAGIAGLLKTVLALKHRQIPESLNFSSPNPKIKFESSPFYVPTKTIDWQTLDDQPRRAGVSSFGIGGSNVHVILEESIEPARPVVKGPHLLVFSARSANALNTMRENFANFLEKNSDTNLADAAYTLQVGRRTFPFRYAIAVNDVADAIQQLRKSFQARAATTTGVAMLFTGQGVPILNTGRALYEEDSFFRETIDACSRMLAPHLGLSLVELLYPSKENELSAKEALSDTKLAQPALLIIEYALTRLLQRYGVSPEALLGHSLGQYCAAVIGGVFSINDALALVARRGALMQSMRPGCMLSVQLNEQQTRSYIQNSGLDLAASNSPDSCAVAGPESEIAKLESRLELDGVAYKRSSVNRAFHSAMTDPCLSELENAVRATNCHAATTPIICNVTGQWLSDQNACSPEYWSRHTRDPVRFTDSIQTLATQPDLQWLEIGPAPILTGLVRRNKLPETIPGTLIFTGQSRQDLLSCLGQLWQSGIAVDWKAISGDENSLKRIALPTYPFERKRYWVDADQTGSRSIATVSNKQPANIPSAQDQLLDALYVPRWVESKPEQTRNTFKNVLFFNPQNDLGQAIHNGLTDLDIHVVSISDLDSLDIATSEEWDAMIYAWPLDHQGLKFGDDAIENSFYALMDAARVFSQSTQNKSAPLIFLTTQCVNPLSTDVVDPYQAAVLGAAREIPQEIPWIQSRCIDIGTETDVADILTEIFDARDDFAVALRQKRRFHLSMAPLKDELIVNALPIKQKGVYWIIGGTGGVGMTMARYLAKNYQSRIVISGRQAGVIQTGRVEIPAKWLQKQFRTLEKQNNITSIVQRDGLSELLSRYSASLVWEYLCTAGLDPNPGTTFSASEVEQALRIQTSYAKFLSFMLDLLVRTGFVELVSSDFKICVKPQSSETLKTEILKKHPEFKGMVDFMQYCSTHYPQVLSGQLSGVSVLYPDGSATKMLDAVSNTAEHSCIRTQLDLLSAWCRKIASQQPDQPLRILEVGGGHGMMTDTVLGEIGNVEYYFTDIGKSFVDARIKRSKETNDQRVVCKTLDISRDPMTQGFTPAQFDLVLGMNVIHATPNIGQTLCNIRSLLKPGGDLVLLETVRQEDWVDIVWGLTPGWWAFNDLETRTSSPLLAPEKWQDVLIKNRFDEFFTSATTESKHDAALMIARRSLETEQQNAQIRSTLTELESLGSEVLLIPADVGDQSSVENALANIQKHFGKLDGVLNCGMVLEDASLASKTRAQASRILRPKAMGVKVLDQVLEQVDLDFIVLFSSLSSLNPGPGQFDYAAANAVMDAYARSNTRKNRQVVAINWNRWRESGFVAKLNEAHQSADNQIIHKILLNNATQWVLSEHRIQDVSLLPGTAYIEHLVRFALDQGLTYPIQIDHLQFIAPCRVEDSIQKTLLLTLQGDKRNNHFDFEFKLDHAQVSNAMGEMHCMANVPRHHHDLQFWRDECTIESKHEHPESESLAQLGPRWKCLSTARFNADRTRAIAHIVLGDAFLSELNDHPLHPALLDVASGFACSGAYLPFGMKRLMIEDRLPASFYSLVNISHQGGHPLLDIYLVDEQGDQFLSIEGYLLRPPQSRYSLRQLQQDHIESLSLVEVQPAELHADDVEIEVIAAGLNFKDVLLASGMLSSVHDLSVQDRVFGAECAGRIKRVGQHARQKWQVGDEVIATAPGSLSEYVVVPANQVFIKPASLSFADAASLPVAFATAYFALHTLGRIQQGQRVLIHSATGGVGLAAVQIAKHAGAEIFATAGNESKRAYLRELGIPHVMDSRSLDFAQQIKELTQDQGVDLALNALSGEKLLATLDIVAKNGVFLELGKRDILSGSQLPLGAFDKGIGFFAIDFTPEHRAYSAVMQSVLDLFNQSYFQPLPHTIYALKDAAQAFQFMLESKHIGKLILAPEPSFAIEKGVANPTVHTAHVTTTLADGLSDEEGWKVFKLALQSHQSQIAVIPQETHIALDLFSSSKATSHSFAESPALQSQDSSFQTGIAWESETQRKLAGIWQAVLGQDVASPDDHFFELRGDSLLAISVLAKIRQQMGAALEPSALFTAPTLRELAAVIDQKVPPTESTSTTRPSLNSAPTESNIEKSTASTTTPSTNRELPVGIVPLHKGGNKTPLFVAPPIMGTLFPYIQFAQLLGKDRPIYGLSPRVDKKGVPEWKTMEEQARFYVQDIIQVQPQGPYQLAGWSFGASVAFEVARQLEADGREVSLFAAIDYPAQGTSQSTMLDFMRFFGASTLKNLASYLRDYMYLRHQSTDGKKSTLMGNIVENAVISKIIAPEAQEIFTAQPDMPEMMQVYRANASALANYHPDRSYKGKIDLFRTEDHNMKRHNHTLEWEKMTHGRVQVHKIGGTHMTLLRSPYVEKLAAIFKTRLK